MLKECVLIVTEAEFLVDGLRVGGFRIRFYILESCAFLLGC